MELDEESKNKRINFKVKCSKFKEEYIVEITTFINSSNEEILKITAFCVERRKVIFMRNYSEQRLKEINNIFIDKGTITDILMYLKNLIEKGEDCQIMLEKNRDIVTLIIKLIKFKDEKNREIIFTLKKEKSLLKSVIFENYDISIDENSEKNKNYNKNGNILLNKKRIKENSSSKIIEINESEQNSKTKNNINDKGNDVITLSDVSDDEEENEKKDESKNKQNEENKEEEEESDDELKKRENIIGNNEYTEFDYFKEKINEEDELNENMDESQRSEEQENKIRQINLGKKKNKVFKVIHPYMKVPEAKKKRIHFIFRIYKDGIDVTLKNRREELLAIEMATKKKDGDKLDASSGVTKKKERRGRKKLDDEELDFHCYNFNNKKKSVMILRKDKKNITNKEEKNENSESKKTKDSFYDLKISSIIKDTNTLDFILNKIKYKNNMQEITNIQLLYQASRDGPSSYMFHQLCDNKNNLIIFIETDGDEIFGGYTQKMFESTVIYKRIDKNSFLFNVNKQKIYNSLKDDKYQSPGILSKFHNGPCFLNDAIYTGKNLFSEKGRVGRKFCGYNFQQDFEINNGKECFITKEIEVFQIHFDDVFIIE